MVRLGSGGDGLGLLSLDTLARVRLGVPFIEFGQCGGNLGFLLRVVAVRAFLFFLAEAEELAGGLDQSYGLGDEPLDGLMDGFLDLLDDGLDGLGDIAEAEQAGQEADGDRDGLGQGVLYLLRGLAERTRGDLGDAVDDGVDEFEDLLAAGPDELEDVVDRLAGLEERRGGVEQADQPGDARP